MFLLIAYLNPLSIILNASIPSIRESVKRGVYLSWLQCRLLSLNFALVLITLEINKKENQE